MKKKTAIILAGLGICLCLVGAILFFVLRKSSDRPVLYYNLDGYIYQNPNNSALSNREPNANGVYKINFVAEGGIVTYTTKDAKLVDLIDYYQVLTMQVSSDGTITSVSAPPAPISTRNTIQQISEKSLLLNTSIAYTGAQLDLPLAENCRFYDVSNDGAYTQPEIMDEVLAYGNSRGEATDVFILRRTPKTKLYWRLDQKYDARHNLTTRELNENGFYTIGFAVEGQQLQLQCKDRELVTAIDALSESEAAMGLVVDDNGFITQMLPAYRGLRGRQLFSSYDVTAIEGDRFTVVNKSLSNQAFHISMSDDCQIYDVSSGASSVGVQTSALQVGDRVTIFSDSMGIATHILVHVRLLDSPVYFNIMRLYEGGNTLRQPDAEGWYNIQMVSSAGLLTLKTKEKAIATKVDSYSNKGMGLELDGDVILRVFDTSCAIGGGSLASRRYVFNFNDALIVARSAYGNDLNPVLIHPDCKILDATGGPNTGSEIKLQEGDQFYAFGNADNLAVFIFVIRRG